MNSKRATPFQSWLDWNPEHRMLYRFIISQLHYDGLSTIALVLAQSLHQVNTVKPSNDLSQLVSMCVQWGQLAGNNHTAFCPVVKPQATLPFPVSSSSFPSLMLEALSQNKSSYEAELLLQENLITAMKRHRSVSLSSSSPVHIPQTQSLSLNLPISLCSSPPTTPSSRVSTFSSDSSLTSSFGLPVFSPMPPSRTSPVMTSSVPLMTSSVPLMTSSVPLVTSSAPLMTSSSDSVANVGVKRPKSDESMGEESPKRQCPSDSPCSAGGPVSISSEQEGTTPSSPQLSSSAEESELNTFNPISALNSWTCPKCDTNVTNMPELATHIKLCLSGHGDNYCNECGRGYSSKASLQRHISVVHRKERNYECHICRKRFGQQIHVDVHMRLHTGEKPFVCHLCNDSFKQSAHLKRHMQCHIRSPTEFSTLYQSPNLKHDQSPDHHEAKPSYDMFMPRFSSPYNLLSSPTVSDSVKMDKISSGLVLGEPHVLGELQNKYTMELIKLIGQTTEEQRKNISR